MASSCSGRTGDRTSDAGSPADAGSGTDGGSAHDGGPSPDAGPAVDAGGVCAPTPGTAVTMTGCDLLQLAIIEHDGAPSEVRLTGRIYPIGSTPTGCAVVDGVDILSGGIGSALVQHLPGGETVTLDSSERELARGVPVADLTDRCASDDQAMRFEVYGIVVRGRVDGGTFEADCARAEGGGRWPPALRVTCHRNIEEPPYGGNASVSLGSFMGTTFASTMLYAAAQHGPTGALTTVDSTIHVIARRESFDPGPPIASHDTTGWMGSASESGSTPSYSQLQAFAGDAQFGTDLCPPPSTTPPGPGWIAPPVFLARMTGMGGHGAYSTEVFVNGCYTTTTPPTP